MKRIVGSLVFLVIATWFSSLWLVPPNTLMRTLIHEALYVSGVMAWAFMVLIVVIAARPSWIERVTGTPLDQLYRWHRTLGFWTVALSLVHYLGKGYIFKTLILLFMTPIAPPPQAQARVPMVWSWDMTMNQVAHNTYMVLNSFAKVSSEYAIYVMLGLIVMVFIQKIGYRTWLSWHRLFGAMVLILCVHAIRLADPNDFATPFGVLNIVLTAVGFYYSVMLLCGRKGGRKNMHAHVTEITPYEGMTLLSVQCTRDVHYRTGQFAFLKLPGHEKHPFSIVHYDAPTRTMQFAIKGVGRYTQKVIPQLQVGEHIDVEGPWGQFYPHWTQAPQVWVAMGVGIAPFMAWLEEACQKDHGRVRLYWCVRDVKAEPLAKRLQSLCEKAQVELQIVESTRQRITPQDILTGLDTLPARLAICTRPRFAKQLTRAYCRLGGAKAQVDREFFSWRA